MLRGLDTFEFLERRLLVGTEKELQDQDSGSTTLAEVTTKVLETVTDGMMDVVVEELEMELFNVDDCFKFELESVLALDYLFIRV